MYQLDEKKLLALVKGKHLSEVKEIIGVGIIQLLKKERTLDWCKEVKTSKKSLGAYTDEFLEFWNLYPKKRKIGKGAALSVWITLKPIDETLKACKEALTWQCKNQNFMTYTPMPETYLRQRRFEDEDPFGGEDVKLDMNGMPI